MRAFFTAAVTFVLSCGAFAQPPAPATAFEVAAIKPHVGPLPRDGGHLTASGPRLSVAGYSLLGLLMYAFEIKMDQIPGRDALDHTMYDIEATAADGRPRSREEFRELVQSLLADRFRLRVHREKKETPVYALVVGKNGVKFQESSAGDLSAPQLRLVGSNTEAVLPKVTMAELAARIAGNAGLDRPVIDKTGLTGTYRLTLTYTPESRMPAATAADTNAIRIFTAVEEQLGLKLVPQSAPFETLIVDHVAKPSAN